MAKKSAFSIPEIKAFWASKSVKRSKGRNDRLEKNAGGVTYYLFGNAIAHYDPGTHTLTLSDARHQSITTKDRLNGLGANITQKDFIWYTVIDRKVVRWPGSRKLKV